MKSLQLNQMTNSLKLIREEEEQKGTSSLEQQKTTKPSVEAVEETKSDEDTAAILMLQTQLQGIQKERDTLLVQLRNCELRCRLLQEQVSTVIITLIDV